MPSERGPRNPEHASGQTRIFCDSREEAVEIVKAFWRAMPHAETLPEENDVDGWCSDLTAGDRTRVVSAGFHHPGKWIASFQGNHMALTREAETWLKEKNNTTKDRS